MKQKKEENKTVILYTIEPSGHTSSWMIVDADRWDILTEHRREIITYNGGWALVEKIN